MYQHISTCDMFSILQYRAKALDSQIPTLASLKANKVGLLNLGRHPQSSMLQGEEMNQVD